MERTDSDIFAIIATAFVHYKLVAQLDIPMEKVGELTPNDEQTTHELDADPKLRGFVYALAFMLTNLSELKASKIDPSKMN